MKNFLIFVMILFISCYSLNAQNTENANRDWKKYLRKQELIDYIENSIPVKKVKTNSLPFKSLEYNKVIAYDYQGNQEALQSIISKNGSFVPVVTKQQSLNQEQVQLLVST